MLLTVEHINGSSSWKMIREDDCHHQWGSRGGPKREISVTTFTIYFSQKSYTEKLLWIMDNAFIVLKMKPQKMHW
jgi:hypothetical protein